MSNSPERKDEAKSKETEKMRDEIRSKVESEVASAIKEIKDRVKPAAPAGTARPAGAPGEEDVPRAQGVCWACGGSGRCQVCHGRGCGYCFAGACGSCKGHGST